MTRRDAERVERLMPELMSRAILLDMRRLDRPF